MKSPIALLLTSVLLIAEPATKGPVVPVSLARLPDGGIQPVSMIDEKGTAHIVYFAGDPAHGDLLYVSSRDGGATFSRPMRVNHLEGSAIAAGNIRGARIAVGKAGRVHVAWNGSGNAAPKDARNRSPMLYARLNDARTEFEPERNLIHEAYGVDGGGAIAADGKGNVYVFWHAPLPGKNGEENRRVWLAQSTDDGKTFAAERVAYDKPVGACGCCGMQAYADRSGVVYALFRSAYETMNRDMYLIRSSDQGGTFTGAEVAKWHIGACVMSSESFTQSAAGTLAAWEAEKQVAFAVLDADGKVMRTVNAPGSTGDRKHPVLASDSKGNILLAWTEGMGWKKGGTVSWQVFDRDGNAIGEPGRTDGVPVWGLLSALPRAGGGFTILY